MPIILSCTILLAFKSPHAQAPQHRPDQLSEQNVHVLCLYTSPLSTSAMLRTGQGLVL